MSAATMAANLRCMLSDMSGFLPTHNRDQVQHLRRARRQERMQAIDLERPLPNRDRPELPIGRSEMEIMIVYKQFSALELI